VNIQTFLLITLGCFRNEVESDLLRSELDALGISETGALESADVVIVNTCGFISEACDEGIDTILELHDLSCRLSRRPPMLVLGCMSQRYGAELMRLVPEIDGILGANWVSGLADALGRLSNGERYEGRIASPRLPDVARSVDSSENASLFVRVADGCDRGCRFCSIPSIRGPYRSREPEDIFEEIRAFCREEEREVILLAQDLTSYGLDLPGRIDLTGLIRDITRIDNVRWLRLLYLQPEGVTDELILEVTGNPVVCDYFDIPFQHASADVLRGMGRPGDARSYLALLERVREHSAEAAIRTTLMVGYPGETEYDFEELLGFVRSARFDWLGGFVFSPEEGTAAATLEGQVPSDIAVSRYNRLLEIQDEVEGSALERNIGRRLEVVIDGYSDIEPYRFVGRSYREAPVVDGSIYLTVGEHGDSGLTQGTFEEALITGQEGLDLVGEL
jgi:ribosomal protein S12 methylthiotransferase